MFNVDLEGFRGRGFEADLVRGEMEKEKRAQCLMFFRFFFGYLLSFPI